MSITFEVSEVFAASPERVFDALLDLERAHLWMPNLVRMESLSAEPPAVGSAWRETRKLFGKESTEQFEVVDLDRPRRLEVVVDGSKGSSGRGEYVFSYRLEPVASGTSVQLRGEIRGMSGIMMWLGKLLVGPYRKACAKDLKAMKSYLEEGEGAGAGRPPPDRPSRGRT
jgi:uncharacterized protein YndB with AHSA1/START domain